MYKEKFGFIGLGNMGKPMARNAVVNGLKLHVYDIAGTRSRAPEGAEIAKSEADVAKHASVIALSLPSVETNRSVIDEIVKVGQVRSVVIDTCTIGKEAAAENAKNLSRVGIDYVDSPVSGLQFRAEEGTLASMLAGPSRAIERARPLIESYSENVFHIGEEPGLGQCMKVVNNALAISSFVTTSEALIYGEMEGLKIETMLLILNASSGRNFTTSEIFPKYVATGKYDESGSEAHIIKKDLELFVSASSKKLTHNSVISQAYESIKALVEDNPKQDMMRIYPFIRDKM